MHTLGGEWKAWQELLFVVVVGNAMIWTIIYFVNLWLRFPDDKKEEKDNEPK